MVGQRQGLHAVIEGSLHQDSGREGTVGGGAVAVQVNIHSGAFAVIDVCYYAVTSCFWLPL